MIRETSWKTATTIASTTAIQRPMRVRRARSQRPGLLVPCSIAFDESMSRFNRTTLVPSSQLSPTRFSARCAAFAASLWWKSPYTAGPAPVTSARKAPRARSSSASGDDARSFGGSAARSRGRRTRSSAARSAARRSSQPAAPSRRVEGGVDGRGRRLRGPVRDDEDDPEVLRQVERRELRAVARAELRAVGEEERDVGAEGRGERVQLGLAAAARAASRSRAGARSRRRSCRRRCRRRPGAASRSSRCQRGSTPACVGERLERAADERVGAEAVDAEVGGRLDLDPVGDADALVAR